MEVRHCGGPPGVVRAVQLADSLFSVRDGFQMTTSGLPQSNDPALRDTPVDAPLAAGEGSARQPLRVWQSAGGLSEQERRRLRRQRIRRAVRYYALRLVRQTGTPEQIAGGMALGAFLAFASPPGLQTLMAVAFSTLLRVNPLVAMAAVWITNPLTMPALYALCAAVGSTITGISIVAEVPSDREAFWLFLTNISKQGRVAVVLGVGALAVGATAAIVVYYPAKLLVIAHRHRRAHRRAQRAAARQPLG